MRLKYRIIAVFSIILLVVLGMAGANTYLAADYVETAYTSGAVLLAEEQLRQVTRDIIGRTKDVKDNAATVDLVSAVEASNRQFEEKDDIELFLERREAEWVRPGITPFVRSRINTTTADRLRHWAELTGPNPLFREAIVTNQYGAVVAATNKTTDYRQADEQWWQDAWENGIQVRPDVYDESSDTYGFRIVTPITNSTGGRIGVFSAMYSATDLVAPLQRFEELADIPLQVHLASGSGTLLYGTTGELLEDVSGTSWFQEATSRSGAIHRPRDDSAALIVYARNMPEENTALPDWRLTITYPDTVFEPVRTMTYVSGLLTALLVLVLLLGGAYFYRSIYQPIQSLTTVVKDISHGKLATQIPEKTLERDDEFGELARAFNRILVSLKLAVNSPTDTS